MNGEITQTSSVYLTPALSEMLVAQCDWSAGAIELTVEAILDPSMNPVGYSYSFKSLVEIQKIGMAAVILVK